MNEKRMLVWTLLALALVFWASMCGACSKRQAMTPLAPEPPPEQTAPVLVTALAYGSNQPLAGARVDVNGSPTARTDMSGNATVTVSIVRETCITVALEGWRTLIGHVCALVTVGPEHWTFYLEKE